MKCWICGDKADSREHLVKASDIKSRLGGVSPSSPVYMHTKEKRNRKVGGLKSDKLKSDVPMCAKCNNQRTQPYDNAWEQLSKYLCMRNPPIQCGYKIRLQRVFPGNVKSSMLDVHLFFVKGFGFKIVEGNAPIDIGPFADALLQRQPHPSLHIAICPQLDPRLQILGQSELYANDDIRTGRSVSASWLYYLDRVTVRVMYIEPSLQTRRFQGTWHPTNVTKILRIEQAY